jgi:hypothetical protein
MAMSTSKSHPENSPEGQKAKAAAVEADTSTAEVQRQVDQDEKRGFRGLEVDPTPNENYSVAGVTSGAPTPETDDNAAAKAREGQKAAEAKATGVGSK